MPADGGFGEGRARRGWSTLATVAAFGLLVVAPLAAGALATGSAGALIGIPAESIAVVLILVALPPGRLRAVAAAAFGVFVVLAAVVAALDIGFEATIDRAFSLADDWPAIVSAFGVVATPPGR